MRRGTAKDSGISSLPGWTPRVRDHDTIKGIIIVTMAVLLKKASGLGFRFRVSGLGYKFHGCLTKPRVSTETGVVADKKATGTNMRKNALRALLKMGRRGRSHSWYEVACGGKPRHQTAQAAEGKTT